MMQSNGIKINGYYIPPFTINKGEIVIIQLPNGAEFTDLLNPLVNILEGKEKEDNVIIDSHFKYAEHIYDKGIMSLIRPLTVKRYLRREENPERKVSQQIYELAKVKPTTQIQRLAGTQRRLLSISTAFSCSDSIIFDLLGVDVIGCRTAYDLVKERVSDGGAAIFIDNFEDFTNECTRYVKAEKVLGEIN